MDTLGGIIGVTLALITLQWSHDLSAMDTRPLVGRDTLLLQASMEP